MEDRHLSAFNDGAGIIPTLRRIAIFRALFLGDLLCSGPALLALRRAFPQAEITLIGLPWADELVRRLPYVDRLLVFPGYPGIVEVPYNADRTEAFLEEARATGYDLALQMHGNGTISNGFVAALGAAFTAGYHDGADRRLSLSLPYDPHEHEILRWLRLMRALGVEAHDPRLEFPVTRAEQDRAARLLADAPPPVRGQAGPLVGLHTGAKDPVRRWPAHRFASLANMLVERCNARIVLTGGHGEREITAAVSGAMRYPVLDLAGATGLGEFGALIAQLDLLVTNDTGASHLAVAMETPSVSLFGPTRPEGWAPLDRERHRVVDAVAYVRPAADGEQALRRLPIGPVYTQCAELLVMGPTRTLNGTRTVPAYRERRSALLSDQ